MNVSILLIAADIDVTVVVQSLSVIIALFALVISIRTRKQNVESLREMKTIDLMRSFQERYDNLRWESALQVDSPAAAKRYYERFWNLQLEQFEYWIGGFIQHKTYAFWMDIRRHSFENGEDLFPPGIQYAFANGWEDAKLSLRLVQYSDGRFVRFIERIRDKTEPLGTILLAFNPTYLNKR